MVQYRLPVKLLSIVLFVTPYIDLFSDWPSSFDDYILIILLPFAILLLAISLFVNVDFDDQGIHTSFRVKFIRVWLELKWWNLHWSSVHSCTLETPSWLPFTMISVVGRDAKQSRGFLFGSLLTNFKLVLGFLIQHIPKTICDEHVLALFEKHQKGK